jgi:hypothetical protein
MSNIYGKLSFAYKNVADKAMRSNGRIVEKTACKKIVRGNILFVQLLCACYFLGQYFIWIPAHERPQGGVLCTVFARNTLAIFYKPLVPSMWYGAAHLLDNEGWMLHHTIFTDSLVALVELLFAAWFVLTAAFALPVLLCFFYLPLLLAIPLGVYTCGSGDLIFEVACVSDAAHEKKKKQRKKAIERIQSERGMTEEAVVQEASRVLMIWKRLLLFFVFIALVLSIKLWPFYQGQSYSDVLKQAVAHELSFGIEFWTFNWWIGLFGWPDLALPDTLVLSLSVGTLILEVALQFTINFDFVLKLVKWVTRLDKGSLWGGWKPARSSLNPSDPAHTNEDDGGNRRVENPVAQIKGLVEGVPTRDRAKFFRVKGGSAREESIGRSSTGTSEKLAADVAEKRPASKQGSTSKLYKVKKGTAIKSGSGSNIELITVQNQKLDLDDETNRLGHIRVKNDALAETAYTKTNGTARLHPTMPLQGSYSVQAPRANRLGIVFEERTKGKANGVTVKLVRDTSPLLGQLHVNHVLLAINGQNVLNETIEGVVRTFRAGGDRLPLLTLIPASGLNASKAKQEEPENSNDRPAVVLRGNERREKATEKMVPDMGQRCGQRISIADSSDISNPIHKLDARHGGNQKVGVDVVVVLNGTEGVANALVRGQGLATTDRTSTKPELGIAAGPGDGISDPGAREASMHPQLEGIV